MFYLQEVVLKRAADLAEALYSMPRNNGPAHTLSQLTTRTPTPTYTSYATPLDQNHVTAPVTTPAAAAPGGGAWTDEGMIATQFYGARQYSQMYAY